MKHVNLCIALLGLCSSGYAAVLISDDFSYTNGGLVANSGGNWTNLSGTGTFLQVSSGEVAGLAHGSGSREDATRIFSAPAVSSGSVYSSFSFTVNTAPTAGTDYFFAVHGLADSNFRGRVFLTVPTTAGFRLGISNATATASFTGDLIVGTTYYAVVRASSTTGTNAALWIGTSLSSIAALTESSPTATAADAFTANSLGRAVLRQGGSITVGNSLDFDNLVIGTSFADVAPVPEPSSYASIFGGVALAGVLAVRRRRGRGRSVS
jgi:hypothetical protein